MRPLRALAVYIVVVFIGGALLAPWLYWLVQLFAREFPRLAQKPFALFVERSFLILAVVGIWPVLKSMGGASLGDAGLARPAGQWGRLLYGFVFGLLSVAIVAGLALAFGTQHFVKPTLSITQLGLKFLGISLLAVVVAVLEETLFRGVVFGALRKVFYWVFALVLSSFFYALVHFLRAVEMTGSVTWLSGLKLLPGMIGGFADPQATVPDFFNLALAGALLALAYQRTGNLHFSIGLHGGWVFCSKSYALLTAAVPGANTWFWGTSKLIDGWFALVVLVAAMFVFTRLPVGREKGFHP